MKDKRKRRSLSANRRKKRNVLPTSTIVIGLLLIGISFVVLRSNSSFNEIVELNPEDIIYVEPLHAIHEMNGPTLSSIIFLPKSQPQPKLAVQEYYFDFGELGPADIVTHDFFIQNVGESPLTISRAYTTCGCTTAHFSATVIPPGKAVVMTLTFDAGFHDVSGQTVRRGVMIENNDPNHPQLEIWTQAKIAKN